MLLALMLIKIPLQELNLYKSQKMRLPKAVMVKNPNGSVCDIFKTKVHNRKIVQNLGKEITTRCNISNSIESSEKSSLNKHELNDP